jgi:ribosomal protein S18 acetylase RimI-like enzyme
MRVSGTVVLLPSIAPEASASGKGGEPVLNPRDVGARVSVRHRLSGGRLTDVVGDLVSWKDGRLGVRRADGTVVEVAESAVVAGRTVPAAPPRRRAGVPHASAEDMQRIANAGWPARETQRLGDWLLRAHGGITGRANSVMAVGDPGVDLAAAAARIKAWYAERELSALLQIPEADPRNAELERLGWREQHVTIVQTAPIGPTVDLIEPRPGLAEEVLDEPSAQWQGLMHDLDRDDPQAHLAILTGPPVTGFAVVRDRGEPVAIGRVSIEGPWAGVTSVDVAEHRRREGLGLAVMRTLLTWADGQGARAAYLQVRALNEPALALYRRLGFVTHHPYCYRTPAD